MCAPFECVEEDEGEYAGLDEEEHEEDGNVSLAAARADRVVEGRGTGDVEF